RHRGLGNFWSCTLCRFRSGLVCRCLGTRYASSNLAHSRTRCGGIKLALTVQLIQQGFKFVIGDFVAVRFDRLIGWSRSTTDYLRRKLTLAVQLVQQSFKLVVADFIAVRFGSRGRRLYFNGLSIRMLQGIEQLLNAL